MGNKEIYIVKRDGKSVPFSLDKIKSAIAKAFLSVDFLFFRGMLQKRRDTECFGRNIVLLWEG